MLDTIMANPIALTGSIFVISVFLGAVWIHYRTTLAPAVFLVSFAGLVYILSIIWSMSR